MTPRPRALAPLAALALLAAAPAAGAEDRAVVALLPATGSNVPAGELAAATDILRAYLEDTGRFLVVRAPARGAAEPTALEAGAAAREARAALAVTLQVSRLAATGLARLGAYGPDGALLHQDELGVLGADDLDPALRRLAGGLASGRLARDLAEIDTVTAREEAPLRKVRAYTAFGLELGGLVPVGFPSSGRETGSSAVVGLQWYYDARDWLADVTLSGFASSLDPYWRPDRGLSLGVGVHYPFSRQNVAPYLGARVAWAAMRLAGESGSGLQGRGVAGLLLGRLSDVSVRVELGWFVNAFPLRDPATGKDARVQGATLSVVLVSADARPR